jgi:hypothetical protein
VGEAGWCGVGRGVGRKQANERYSRWWTGSWARRRRWGGSRVHAVRASAHAAGTRGLVRPQFIASRRLGFPGLAAGHAHGRSGPEATGAGHVSAFHGRSVTGESSRKVW